MKCSLQKILMYLLQGNKKKKLRVIINMMNKVKADEQSEADWPNTIRMNSWNANTFTKSH